MNTAEEFKENIIYILENWIPKDCVIRVHEGGGLEDINASLCASLLKTMERYSISIWTKPFNAKTIEDSLKDFEK